MVKVNRSRACSREGRNCARWLLAIALSGAGCSVSHLSYSELERDLDAVARLEGSGDEQRIIYQRKVQESPWYSRWLFVRPVKPLLLLVAGQTTSVELDNPSGRARELAQTMAASCGGNLLHTAQTTQRLVRIAELDPSALNRIVALSGLALLVKAQGFDIYLGIERGDLTESEQSVLQSSLSVIRELRPAGRYAVGEALSMDAQGKYSQALGSITAQPVPGYEGRLALVADLATALSEERDEQLITPTTEALRRALQHAIQWTMRRALQDLDRNRIEVRLRALEILHCAGGPNSVPMLLALITRPSEVAAARGEVIELDPTTQLRLIHMCGQLDLERAKQKVQLPGRADWQSTAPIDFLARRALEDELLSPLQLPALEAMALCIRRTRLDLAAEGDDSGVQWVRAWYENYRKTAL
ncbi:MAG: hypothetical protein EXS02_02300 [Planctomycetes bacterium]|nr:hypothetical protein [Planctomycetota bacterium]